MAEFAPHTNQIQTALQRDYPPFIRNMGSALRLTALQQQELARVQPPTWLPWTMSVLGGDERVPAIAVNEKLAALIPDDARTLLGGEVTMQGNPYFDFRRGELAQQVHALYAQDTPGSRSRMDKLSTSCARFMITLGAVVGVNTGAWQRYVETVPQTCLKPDDRGDIQIEFPGGSEQTHAVDGSTRTLVTYGPGMTGSILAGEMAGRTKEIHFVSGGVSGLFINKWTAGQLEIIDAGIANLRQTGVLQKMIKPGLKPEEIRVPKGHFYHNGIARAIGDIAHKTVRRGNPVDVVLMSAVHSAGTEECIAGVKGAHDLLREGGLLVVKAPRVSVGNEGGLDRVAPVAYQLFGGPAAAGACGRLGLHADPQRPLSSRPADFAIYQKQR